jgi:hypothetical protein
MLLDASLWPNVERRLSDELGAPLRPLGQLGRPRENRITWAADADGMGEVIVKARFRDRAGAKTRWCARNLPLLATRATSLIPSVIWACRTRISSAPPSPIAAFRGRIAILPCPQANNTWRATAAGPSGWSFFPPEGRMATKRSVA